MMDNKTRQRFLSKLVIVSETGCVEYTKAKLSGGYGAFWYQGRHVPAHRFAWLLWEQSPFPTGLVMDHLCRNPPCVNLSHFEWVTLGENVLRGVGITATNREKTHCPKGHPYNYTYPSGKRGCNVCKRDWARANRASS